MRAAGRGVEHPCRPSARFQPVGGAGAVVTSPVESGFGSVAATASSSRTKSSIDAQRASGSFSSARITSASSAGAMARSGATSDGGTGVAPMCLLRISTDDSPPNGTRPVKSSYMITPTA